VALLLKIDLTESEANELVDLIKNCPDQSNEDCKCEVHKFMDSFESKNSHRRVVLIDDYVRW
jgi:hypothetical protein